MKRVVRLFCCAALAAATHAQPRPVRINPQQWQHAEQLARSGRHREALNQYKHLLANGADENAIRGAGLTLKGAGAVAEAEALFTWARKQLKKPAAFASDLADLYQSQLSYPEAVREWSLLLDDGSAAAVAGIDAIGVQVGYDRIASLMEREGHSGDLFLRTRGEMWIKAGNRSQAWASFKRISDARLLAGLLSGLLDSPDITSQQAVSFIGDYLDRKPQDRAAWELRLAEALAEDGKPDEAVRRLEKAAQRDPAAGLLLARISLRDLHRPERAIETLSSAGGRWPEPFRSEARFLQAEALMAQALWDSARQALIPLSDSNREPPVRQRSLFLQAEISFLQQDFVRAAEQYAQVAALGPAGDAVNDALSRMLLISGNKTDTMESLRALAQARSLRTRFRFDEADQQYRALAERAAGSAIAGEACFGRAEMAEQRRDYRRAAGLYAEAGQNAIDTTLAAEALYRSGALARDRIGDPALAAQAWEQGIRRYPDTSWADLMRSGLEKMKPRREE